MSLSSPEACQRFLRDSSPQEVAERLRADQRACREGGTPTLLAHFVPRGGSKESGAIIQHLMPETDTYVPKELQKLQYAGILEGITSYLANMQHLDTNRAINETTFQDRLTEADLSARLSSTNMTSSSGGASVGTSAKAAADLLRKLQLQGLVTDADALPAILGTLDALSVASKTLPRPPRRAMPDHATPCYICRFKTAEMHELYSSLCRPCGAFNIAESSLSTPENLNLAGKVALVTGGRVNLGFHTALRLLRCGATVIASTRYPQDAEIRYRAEKDSDVWVGRLSIVGADFRTAKDVFRLVGSTRRLLGSRKLFVLVNNAAQTLTDPIHAEQKAIANESRLQHLMIADGDSAIVTNGYAPQVRGGSLMPGGLIEVSKAESEEHVLEPFKSYSSVKTEPASGLEINGHHTMHDLEHSPVSLHEKPLKSSWVQRIDEIPYEDIITAHSVNTFVPLILIRELLPLMIDPQSRKDPTRPRASQPAAHIINVSSREGIFEVNRRSREKPAKHVHTNMTKAGLNMITETEADEAWDQYRIAMNSVDPGYMSAAPEMRRPSESTPLSFEDGAGRVLWTVAIAEGKTDRNFGPIYKRFLKHFGSAEVNVGLGR